MTLIRRIFIYILVLASFDSAAAQELNCAVEFNTAQLPNTNKSVFETLSTAVNEYMNTTTFTSAQFSPVEKIDCRLFFTVKEYTDDGMVSGDLQVQASRPVFNSTYTSTLLNFKDAKIDFTYQEGEPLTFSTNTMESQLTAILNFYAYFILALDFDSFGQNGGPPYWEQVKQIVQMAQSSGESGWRAFEDNKNRSALMAAFAEGKNGAAMRTLYYQYHRMGLDQMAMSVDKGRSAITETLANLQTVYDLDAMSVALSLFKDTKLDELVNIYSEAGSTERDKIYNLLEPIYPSEQERITKIKKGKEK